MGGGGGGEWGYEEIMALRGEAIPLYIHLVESIFYGENKGGVAGDYCLTVVRGSVPPSVGGSPELRS